MKKTLLFCSVISLGLLLTACGSKSPQAAATGPVGGPTTAPTPAVTPSPTQDLCTQANLPESVKIINTYVQQFDNYSSLSVQVPAAQLPQLIASMKAIRQALQQQTIPPCLTELKHYALQYMDTVILTVVTFQANPNMESLSAGIALARQYNDQYATELARLLGVTLAPPNATPAAQETAAAPTAANVTVLNPGPNPLNLHVSPSLTSQSTGLLNANESARALGKSSNGEWIQVEVPNQPGARAWLYASLVQFTSGDANAIPIATP